MVKVSQSGGAAPATHDLKSRIVSFMGGASTEITPSEESRLPELKSLLPAGTAVFVAHTPNTSFGQVVHAALAVRRAGFLATPHIAVRRVPNAETLRAALAELRAGGVEDILLIAGDAPRPIGEFSGTLAVLESRILEESGITRIGVAGHPEGHSAVASAFLWEALEAKQAFAARTGVSMHIVTQFGLSGSAFKVGHGYILGLPLAGYLTWQGRMLENNGIAPKFSIELSREALKQGRDTQLGTAIDVVKAL